MNNKSTVLINLNIKNIIQFIILLFGLFSCKEIYDDPTIKSNKEVIVVQGSITDQDGPYTIRITNALPFNSKSITYIGKTKRADIVRIFDDTGKQETLTETGPGVYTTKASGIKGVIGRKYTLQIITRDGSKFESTPCTMEAPPIIDDIYGEKAEVKYLVPESDGNYRSESAKGLKVLLDISSSLTQNIFLKFDAYIINETVHSEQPDPTVMPIYVRCWNGYNYKQSPNIKSSVLKDTRNIIKKHTLCFLPLDKNPQPDDSISTPPVLIGWITTCYVYTISEGVYNYYNQLNEQLNSKNNLFDPIPTQLTGNIRCLSDSTRQALGVFEVSSVISKNTFFPGYIDGPEIKKKYLEGTYFADPEESCTSEFIPDFWIDY